MRAIPCAYCKMPNDQHICRHCGAPCFLRHHGRHGALLRRSRFIMIDPTGLQRDITHWMHALLD